MAHPVEEEEAERGHHKRDPGMSRPSPGRLRGAPAGPRSGSSWEDSQGEAQEKVRACLHDLVVVRFMVSCFPPGWNAMPFARVFSEKIADYRFTVHLV